MSKKRNTTTGKKPVIVELPYFLTLKHSAQKSKHGTDLTNPLYDSKKKPVIKFSSKSSSKGGKTKKVFKKKRNKTKKRKYKK